MPLAAVLIDLPLLSPRVYQYLSTALITTDLTSIPSALR